MAAKKASTAATISGVLADFEKQGIQFGFQAKPQQFYTTSNVAIDWACGGGLPVGKLVEVYGKSGSGKTTLCMQAAAAIQQSGGKVAWLDYERAFDADYAKQLGINLDDTETFIYVKPTSLEMGGDLIYALANTGEINMIVVDSIARMTSQSELDGSMSQLTVGDKAKMLYKLTRKVLNTLDDHDCTLVFLNHLLDQINTTMPGTKSKITPGGNAVPYFSSLRLECSLMQSIKSESDDAKYKGLDIQMLVTKNRVAPPSRKVTVRNDFGSGFSQMRSALEIAKEIGITRTSGAWTYIEDAKLAQVLGSDKYMGYESFVLAVSSNNEARGLLISLALEIIRGERDANSEPVAVVEDGADELVDA